MHDHSSSSDQVLGSPAGRISWQELALKYCYRLLVFSGVKPTGLSDMCLQPGLAELLSQSEPTCQENSRLKSKIDVRCFIWLPRLFPEHRKTPGQEGEHSAHNQAAAQVSRLATRRLTYCLPEMSKQRASSTDRAQQLTSLPGRRNRAQRLAAAN
jgi:hypothetical protein